MEARPFCRRAARGPAVSATRETKAREIKGRHVLAVALAAFSVVVAVNMVMVFAATGSFPGLVEKNSYVASQKFNIRVAAQNRLGWKSRLDYESGRLAVTITGADGEPVRGIDVALTVGRPADARSDRTFAPLWDGAAYVVAETLDPGVWRAEIIARRSVEEDPYHAMAKFMVR